MKEEDIIREIREKIKYDSNYVNPCGKMFQEDIRKYGFKSGFEFTNFLEKVGILKDRYLDDLAKRRGFKSGNEYKREYLKEWRHNTGRQFPISDNPDCTRFFGEFIAERYIMKTFEDPIPAPPNNPWFDWICKKGQKIQCKSRCLSHFKGQSSHWNYVYVKYGIIPNYNDIADYFIFSGWDNRDSLSPLHVWMFHKDDIIRGSLLWMRNSLAITNSPKGLAEFNDFDVTNRLNKLKEICNRENDNKI